MELKAGHYVVAVEVCWATINHRAFVLSAYAESCNVDFVEMNR